MDGPVRRRMRERLTARSGLELPTNLAQGTLELGGRPRTYAFVPGPRPEAPLLLVLHGGGGAGVGMAALTGLAERAPAAGFAAVFPDGFGRVWNDNREAPRLARREGVDDVAFLQALVARLVNDGVAHRNAVFAVGMSNGSMMSEYLARHGLLPLAGLALASGGATLTSRAAAPRPKYATTVLLFHGTADPIVPYGGGPITLLGGIAGQRGGANRRGRGRDRAGGRGAVAPIEVVAADWAAVNGAPPAPVVEPLAVAPGDLPVTRLQWTAPARPAVILHRIEGGGHTWPGGTQYLPERVVGAVARLDATGIVLNAFGPVSERVTPAPRGPQ